MNAILERVRLGDRVHNYETIRRRKDGSLIDVSVTVSPIRGAEGTVVGASRVVRDITERKRSEAHISVLTREAEHRAKNLLTNVKAIVRLSQSDTPDGLKKSRDALSPLQMFTRCSSSLAGLEPSYVGL